MLNYWTLERCKNTFSVKWLKIEMFITFDREVILTWNFHKIVYNINKIMLNVKKIYYDVMFP